MIRTSLRSTLLLACGLLLGCVQPSAPATGRDEQPSSAAAPRSTPDPASPKSAPPKPAPADRAHVSVDGVGLHVLDDRGWRQVLETRSSIRDMLMLDGELLVLSAFGVQRVDADGQAEMLASLDGQSFAKLGDPLALATADGRELWVAGELGVARHSGSWEITPMDARDPASIDLALDRASQPWLVFGSLSRRAQDRWQPFVTEPGIQPLALAADPRSEAMLVHAGCQPERGTCLLLRVSGEQVASRIELPMPLPGDAEAIDDCPDYNRLAVSADGERAVIAGRCGLIRFELGLAGEANPQRLGISDGWPGQPLRSLALDAGGRVWVGTPNGLTIVSTDGEIEDYPLGQLDDIVGSVGPMLVEGKGPPPPELGRVRIGGLAGTLVSADKQALAGVRLELCNRLPAGAVEPSPERSRCAGVEPIHATTTDDQGRFELTGLNLGHYYFAVELDGRWAIGEPKALNMRAGMSGNVGKVVVSTPQ